MKTNKGFAAAICLVVVLLCSPAEGNKTKKNDSANQPKKSETQIEKKEPVKKDEELEVIQIQLDEPWTEERKAPTSSTSSNKKN